MCLDLYFGKIYPFKKIQIISHDWIPGNKFIVCCITFGPTVKNACLFFNHR